MPAATGLDRAGAQSSSAGSRPRRWSRPCAAGPARPRRRRGRPASRTALARASRSSWRRLGLDVLARAAARSPSPAGRSALGVVGAEVVGVRLGVRGQRPDHGGLVAVDVGECRDGGLGARGAGAPPDRLTSRTLWQRRRGHRGRHAVRRWPGDFDQHPTWRGATSRGPGRRSAGAGAATGAVAVREVRWPGPRCPRWPPARQQFDDLVLDSAARLEEPAGAAVPRRSSSRVEDVPPTDPAPWEREVRRWVGLFPPHGRQPARIVIYRRPIESRAQGQRELAAIVQDVVVEQVAALFEPHRRSTSTRATTTATPTTERRVSP